jgi:hypothetical protein
MAKYTTEVRSICETLSTLGQTKGYNDVDTIISEATPKIFSFQYPIFDEAYRIPLEKKIIENYYTREIAHETVGLWKLKLQTKMRQIMPYYNQLYKSELLEFNPFYDVNVTHDRSVTNTGSKVTDGTTIQGSVKKETGTIGNVESELNTGTVKNSGTVNDTGTVTDTGTVVDTGTVADATTLTNNLTDTNTIDGTVAKSVNTDNKDAYSDTPQGGISNVEDYSYLTNYRKVLSTNNENEDVDKVETLKKTGTVGTDSTKTNNLTTTNNLTKGSDFTKTNDLTVTNNLSNQRTGTVTNNLTTDIDDTIDVNSIDTINNTETYLETIIGKQGGENYSDLMLKFRKTFLNIDMQVINELSELFFGLW